jgi:hypothetical protein
LLKYIENRLQRGKPVVAGESFICPGDAAGIFICQPFYDFCPPKAKDMTLS